MTNETQSIIEDQSSNQASATDTITSHLPGFLYRCNINPPWNMFYLSENVVEITGYNSREFKEGTNVSYESLIHDDDKSDALKRIKKARKKNTSFRIEYRLIDRDGHERWVEQQGEWIANENSDNDNFVQGYIHDITEQKQLHLEDRIIRKAADFVTRSTDFEQAVKEILKMICSACNWKYGEIWFPQFTDSETFTAQVHYNPENGDLEAFWEGNRTVNLQRGEGLVGRVWEQGETEWTGSKNSGPTFLESELAHKAGLKTALGIPCESDGETVAVLVFYRNKKDHSSLMVDLLETVGLQLGPLLREKQMKNKLKEQQAFYQSLFVNSPAPILVGDLSDVKNQLDELESKGIKDLETYLLNHRKTLKKIVDSICALDLNQSALDILNVESKDQIISSSLKPFCNDETYDAFAAELATLYEGTNRYQDERPYVTANDETIIVLNSSSFAGEYRNNWAKCYFTFTDITDQKLLQERLEDTLDERTILLKEVHHRVKNNLQVIISLIRLQLQNMSSDPNTEKLLTNVKNRIFSMALIHEQVYDQSSFDDISVNEYLTELVTHVISSHSLPNLNIQLELDLEEINLNLDLLITCGLIVHELVSNAINHGFNNNTRGKLQVQFKTLEDGSYELSVADNGNGWQNDKCFEETTSLGVTLIRNLSRKQLHGEVECSETDAGVTVRIRFDQIPESESASIVS